MNRLRSVACVFLVVAVILSLWPPSLALSDEGTVTYTSSGNAGHIEGGDWGDVYAERNSWVQASIVFSNLRYVDGIFGLDALGNLSEIEDDYGGSNPYGGMLRRGYWYFGLDYQVNGSWIDGWYVRLELVDIDRGGGVWPTVIPSNWAVFNCTWWYQGQFIKNDYIATWYEGIQTDDYRDMQRVHVRLWFNKVNASTAFGGWVAPVYWGWHPEGNWVLNGGAGAKKDAQNAANTTALDSFLFRNLLDGEGAVMSSRNVDLVRFWIKVERNNDPVFYILKVKYTQMLNFNIGQDMTGIDTPSPIEPTLPSEAQSGGILGWFGNVVSGIWRQISEFFGPALLDLWDVFVGFVDSIFTAMGWNNGFSQVLNIITNFVTWLATSITTMITVLTSIFLMIVSFFTVFVNFFMGFINTVVSLSDYLTWIWNAAYPYWGWIPGVVTQLTPFLLFLLALWVISPVFQHRSLQDGLEGMKDRVELIVGAIVRVGVFLWQVVDFAIDTIYRIVEMVPIAE